MTDMTFFDGRIVLKPGDCRDRLKELADNSVDAVVCDPLCTYVNREALRRGWSRTGYAEGRRGGSLC